MTGKGYVERAWEAKETLDRVGFGTVARLGRGTTMPPAGLAYSHVVLRIIRICPIFGIIEEPIAGRMLREVKRNVCAMCFALISHW